MNYLRAIDEALAQLHARIDARVDNNTVRLRALCEFHRRGNGQRWRWLTRQLTERK
jgi:hypothetical protein